LLAIAGISTLTLLGLSGSLLPLYIHEITNLCRRSWPVLAAHLPAVGAIVPLVGLAFVFGQGGLSLIRQLRATRRFLQSLPAEAPELPARLQRLATEIDITHRVDLVQDARTYSFCYGLLRPRICVTTGLLDVLDEAELRALLLHERHHLRQHDPLWILIGDVLADAMSIFPITRVLAQRQRMAQEVAADQAAIIGCDSDVPLSSALLKLLTAQRDRSCVPVAVGAFSVTEERIARLINGQEVRGGGSRTARTSAWAGTILIMVGMLFMSYTGLANMHAINTLPVECVNTVTLLH
jgi:beta-lactamase regulating signal transducer with metallopeptidase domain